MFGGLVNAIWRPLQSIGQQIGKTAPQPNTSPSSASSSSSSSSSFPSHLPGHTPISNATFPPIEYTPVKPIQAELHNTRPTPNEAQTNRPTIVETPTTTSKVLFKRNNNARSLNAAGVSRRGRISSGSGFEIIDHEDEQDQHQRPAISDEYKDNGTRKRAAGAPDSTASNNGAAATASANGHAHASDSSHIELGHAAKKARTDNFTPVIPTTFSPRRTRKSGGGVAKSILDSSVAPSASIFNFGAMPNLNSKRATLFAQKTNATTPKAKSGVDASKGPTSESASSNPPFTSSTSSTNGSAASLAGSLGGFTLSMPPSYPTGPRGTAVSQPPSSVRVDDTDVEMAESPSNARNTNSSASSATYRNPFASQPFASAVPHAPTSNSVASNISPLASLTITPQVPQTAFQSMSIQDPSVSTNAPDPPSASDRIRSFRDHRDARSKASYTSVRQSRKFDELAADERQQGHRGDIKSRTKAEPTPAATLTMQQSAHVPIMPRQRQKPPVPLFWANDQTADNHNNATQQPPPSHIHSNFTPLRPDDTFAATNGTSSSSSSSSAPKPSASSSSSSSTSSTSHPTSLPVKDRIPVTASASFRASVEREEARRQIRQKAQQQAAKEARENVLREKREAAAAAAAAAQQAEAEQLRAQAQAQAEAQQEALRRQQQQQQQQQHSDSDSSTPASRLRRSARHSNSPLTTASSPSPSPPPVPPAATSSTPVNHLRNRFVTPTFATPGPSTPFDTDRRTRSSMASASSSVSGAAPTSTTVNPSPRSRQATLAANIAARKAAEADQVLQRQRDRQAALDEAARAAERLTREKEEHRSQIARRVQMRARGKGYEGLLREFAPQIRADLSASQVTQFDCLRKSMRKAMAKYHPDKHTSSPARNQIEAEEIFIILKKAYDELTALCR